MNYLKPLIFFRNKGFDLLWLCEISKVNYSGFNNWVKGNKNIYKTKRNESYDLANEVIFNDWYKIYGTNKLLGHRLIASILKIGRRTVLSAMKIMKLVTLNRKKQYNWKQHTNKNVKPVNTAPNLLKDDSGFVDFKTRKIFEIVCLDLSEFKVNEVRMYLFCFIDVYSRKILARHWSFIRILNLWKLIWVTW
ncbi:hypothetical protein [Spiroplasma alleghenense]|uniref:Transposase n=1 Tax=Spiroplasma alleghenense TaxID=216931 RepID=A0A345Z2Y2_9MOLU|nr:hypothetical protein [Spiroplasma alleghenense]AXK50961.1 hypothetical protein SALLE_v1c02870 [Spiroplasma alleghenense]